MLPLPQKLSIQVKRAFIAARTFVQGLGVGRDVLQAVQDLPLTPACQQALTKMRFCSFCQGMPRYCPLQQVTIISQTNIQ